MEDTTTDPLDPVEALILADRGALGRGTDLARDLAAHRLAGRVRAEMAGQAAALCHWAQDRGDARGVSHADFHFGYTCPYEAVAAVLRGEPDPRDTDRDLAGEQHRSEVWRVGHELVGNLSFGWSCLDCPSGDEHLEDVLAAQRGAEWHARHPHQMMPRAGVVAEIALDEADTWDLLAEWFGAEVRTSPAGQSGEYDCRMVWPDGREAFERDSLVIVSADAMLPPPAAQKALADPAEQQHQSRRQSR